MKQSLKEILYNRLKEKNAWIHKGDLCELADFSGYLAENAGRRLRELENEGRIKRELRKMSKGGKTVWYHIDNETPKEIGQTKTPKGSRPNVARTCEEIKSILHSLREARASGASSSPEIHQQSLAL
jgi:predicted transcriptional regulator